MKISDANRRVQGSAHKSIADTLAFWPRLRLLRLPNVPPPGGQVIDAVKGLCEVPLRDLDDLRIPGLNDTEASDGIQRAVQHHLLRLTHLNVRRSSGMSPDALNNLRTILTSRSERAELICDT